MINNEISLDNFINSVASAVFDANENLKIDYLWAIEQQKEKYNTVLPQEYLKIKEMRISLEANVVNHNVDFEDDEEQEGNGEGIMLSFTKKRNSFPGKFEFIISGE